MAFGHWVAVLGAGGAERARGGGEVNGVFGSVGKSGFQRWAANSPSH